MMHHFQNLVIQSWVWGYFVFGDVPIFPADIETLNAHCLYVQSKHFVMVQKYVWTSLSLFLNMLLLWTIVYFGFLPGTQNPGGWKSCIFDLLLSVLLSTGSLSAFILLYIRLPDRRPWRQMSPKCDQRQRGKQFWLTKKVFRLSLLINVSF